jgi:hypothetical protein
VDPRQRVERQEEVRLSETPGAIAPLQPLGLGGGESTESDASIADPQPPPGTVLEATNRRVPTERLCVCRVCAGWFRPYRCDPDEEDKRDDQPARPLVMRRPRARGSLRTRVAHETVDIREPLV